MDNQDPARSESAPQGSTALLRDRPANLSVVGGVPAESDAAATDRFAALVEAGRAIASATSLSAVRQAVNDAVPPVLQAARCHTFDVPGAPEAPMAPVTSDSGDAVIEISSSLVNRAIATGQVATAPRRPALCAPISRGGNVVACFYATRWAGEAPFGGEDQRLAAFIAVLAGATLDHVAGTEARFRALVRNSHDLIVVCDATGRTLYVSPSATRVLGYTPSDLMGGGLEPVHPDDQERLTKAFRLAQFSPASRPTTEIRARHGDGAWRWLEILIGNQLADPSVRGMVFNIRDVTERRAAEQRLTFLALHDPLTGLANRRLLLDRLTVALARAARSGRMVAALYLDLDRFKDVNDSLGHEQGDQLLVQAASRLSEVVRDSDTAARLGGDEFVVVVDELADASDAILVARRIEESVRRPFALPGGERVCISASVGVALAHGDADPRRLLHNADIAMYQAKQRGRACHHLYGDEDVGDVEDVTLL